MTKPSAMDRARAYCERWGIRIDIRDNVAWTHDGPGMFGLHWPSRTIVMPSDQDVAMQSNDAMYLVHEVSHVLAGEDPREVNETQSAMLALDFYACKHLRLGGWGRWMQGFAAQLEGTSLATKDGEDWPDLPTRVRGELMRASLAQAVALGLLTERGEPTFNPDAWRPRA